MIYRYGKSQDLCQLYAQPQVKKGIVIQVFSEQWKTQLACLSNKCSERRDNILKKELKITQVITLIKAIKLLRGTEIVSNNKNKSSMLNSVADLIENYAEKLLQERSNQSIINMCDAVAQQGERKSMDNHGKKDANQIALGKYRELMSFFENRSFYKEFKEALDNDFEVMLMAPMSSGKSTLINAMLGMDLLPTANQACTAIVTRIEDNDAMKTYKCRAAFGDNISSWQIASPQLLKEWNSTDECKLVEIEGNLPFVRNTGARLVLYDTPGPNYSCDRRHANTLSRALVNHQFGVIVFLLNANNLGTDDERTMLNQILETKKSNKKFNKRTLFIISKADQFDEEDGENLKKITQKVRKYLLEIGFKSPKILPIMAEAALLARKLSCGAKLSKHERIDLEKYVDQIRSSPKLVLNSTIISKDIKDLIEAGIDGHGMEVSQNVDDIRKFTIRGDLCVSRAELNRYLYSTGLHTLETYFEYLIVQNALPKTISRVSRVLNKHNAKSLYQWINSNQGDKHD